MHPLVTALPEGTRYSVRVVSTGAPIVASIARQRLSGGGSTISDASSEIGTMGAGRDRGYLPAARVLTGSEAHIEFFYANPGVAFTNISVQFIRSNGQVINSSANLTSLNRRARIDLTQVAGLWPDEFFSIRYVATGNANVSAVYTAEVGGDRMSTPFVTASSRNLHLADGHFNPTLTFPNDIEEVFSVFNPFQQAGQNLRYNLLFRFSDNTQIQAFTNAQPLGPLGRADWRAADFPAVLTKLQNQQAARFFSVIVTSEADFATTGSMIAAQTTRIWWNLGLSTTMIASKSPDEPVFFANNPLFN
ncbi:hypothetical protein J4558_27075 [Leptolyngbya sp. 15MV]|nr:hypothetical protein J4558_27075 [Leptolyngbya sp. 15MV]